MTWFLIFGSSLHCAGKCMVKLYAAYIAGAWQSLWKIGLRYANSVIQIHSFCLFTCMYCAGFTLVVFSSDGRKSRQTRFLFDKNNQFLFSSVQLHAFECMLQSTNILILVIELVIWHFSTKNKLMTKKSIKCHSITFTQNTFTKEQNNITEYYRQKCCILESISSNCDD